MTHEEQLREALLEVQLLRGREAKALRETRALLHGLELIPAADDVDSAYRRLLETARNATSADALCIASRGEVGFTLSHGDTPGLADEAPALPAPLLEKARNIVDLHAAGGWAEKLPCRLRGFRSLLVVPIGAPGANAAAVLALHRDRARFSADEMAALRRLATLTAQTVEALDLNEQNRLLAAVISGSSSGFAISDCTRPGEPLIYVNPAFEKLSGYRASEVLGRNCRFLSAEPEDAPERRKLRRAVAEGKGGRFLLRNRRKDGSLFWNALTLFPVKDAQGRVRNLVATQVDATEKVDAQDERDRTRKRMSEALANTQDAFLLLDDRKHILFANPAARNLFPAPRADWRIGTTFDDSWAAFITGYAPHTSTLPEAMRDPDLDTLARAESGTELRLPDGRSVLVRARSASDGGLVLLATNITPMKTAERMLRQRAAAIDAAQDGIAIADDADRLFYVNPNFVSMLGESDETLLFGRRWPQFYLPEERDAYLRDIRPALLNRGTAKTLLQLRTPGGELRHHEYSLSVVQRVGTVIIARDVTDRIHYEERQAELQVQLELSRRQETISQLAAGVAHDFNNLLSAINISADLIATDGDTTPPLRDYARRIGTAGNRAARLVNRLLDLGASPRDAGEIDMRDALREAKDLLNSSIGASARLTLDCGQRPAVIRASATDVVQIVLNLVLNAQDALPEGAGTIGLSLSCVPGSDLAMPLLGTITPTAHYGTITVADTGVGISRAQMPRIFDAYYSTKGDRGTGMGLAMVASMVETAGGALLLDSTPGAGSVFTVCYPLTQSEALSPSAAADLEIPPPVDLTGTTVLLVDDEPAVAEVIGSYLERHGAEVSVCAAPEIALESITEDPHAWTVMVTDYDMPGMNGGALAESARQVAPHLPVIVVTALARRLSDPRVSRDKVHAVIAKPVNMRQLLKAISQLITIKQD